MGRYGYSDHPCGYMRYLGLVDRYKVPKPLSFKEWHSFWDTHTNPKYFSLKYAKTQYQRQAVSARRRGIKWHFAFENWILWWETNLGHDWQNRRGRYLNQYVMARLKDEGPYVEGNVQCIIGKQNISDALTNGRYVRGDKHPSTKLTDKQVARIFTTYDWSTDAAKRYGVHRRIILGIRCGEYRNEVTSHLKRKPTSFKGSNHWNSTLTEADVRQIYKSKTTPTLLARKYNVRVQTINCIVKGISWLHITGGKPSPHYVKLREARGLPPL